MSQKPKKEMTAKQPINPMIILAVFIVLASIATYVVPAGVFERVANKATGYDTIDVSSFHYVDASPIAPFNIFQSFTLGLQEAAYIIFFLMIVGGTFKIVEYTGALHSGLSNLLIALRGKEVIMVPVCVFTFGLVSAMAACCEEYLAFLPLMYVICVAAGFDSLTAVALLFVSSAVGYAGGMTNAFTVGVAQTISEIPMFSGMYLRVAVFIALATVTSLYLMRHVYLIKKHPERNTMAETDKKYAEALDLDEVTAMTGRHKLILLVFGLTFVTVAFCVIKLKFYIDEMSAIFLICALIVGVIGKINPNTFAEQFLEGCKDLLWAGLIIGMCNAVTMILKDANILDTLIYGMGVALEGMPAKVSACGMFVLQDMLNVLIPSGSGQAAVTMPFMAPLSDILGVTRQTAVLAFQMGDAFTNVITPTSGELMAALAICHVPYRKWLKFLAPLWGIWAIIACIFLVIAVSIGYV